MQKSILIPTDFQVESLNTLKLALKRNTGHKVNAMLMFAKELTDSTTELIFYSPQKTINSLTKPEFEEALSILKNRFAKTLSKLNIELFHGYGSNAFKNFLHLNKIDEIYIPKNYVLKQSDESIDPLPFIQNSELPVYEMEWDSNPNVAKEDQLDTLFNN